MFSSSVVRDPTLAGPPALMAGALPASVATVESFGDLPAQLCFPGEEELVRSMAPARRAEFATARSCARAALLALGLPPRPIGRGPHREPIWPDGVVGSITHCRGYRAAACSTGLASLGIDAEPHKPLPNRVAELTLAAEELAMVARLARRDPSIAWDRVAFSAKEAVYKAWFPLTHRWLGFFQTRLRIDAQTGTFEARLSTEGARIDGGPQLDVLHGRHLIRQGLVLTAVCVEGRLQSFGEDAISSGATP